MQTKSARKGEFTTQHARLVLAQWRSNMSLARGYANDGKPEHAAALIMRPGSASGSTANEIPALGSSSWPTST